jgi:hypothetical protein
VQRGRLASRHQSTRRRVAKPGADAISRHTCIPAPQASSTHLNRQTLHNMANNDDNSRRDRDRLEDNPFIAFRRFADSQVSSLLNTVFTLPATIANYNNVHQAREACLFKKADNTQCDELHRIEDEIAGLRHDGQELYRAGELQEVLRKSEEPGPTRR